MFVGADPGHASDRRGRVGEPHADAEADHGGQADQQIVTAPDKEQEQVARGDDQQAGRVDRSASESVEAGTERSTAADGIGSWSQKPHGG